LITKADGGKFGKTEQGNIWLDAKYTTPYAFYQFWLNVSDDDAERYIRIFTMLSKEQIEKAITGHKEAPHLRELQKLLAQEVTTMVHGTEEYKKAVKASAILFGQSTNEALRELDERTFLSVFEGVPQYSITNDDIPSNIIELLAVKSSVFPSKGECRKMIQASGLSVNKTKIESPEETITSKELLNDKYILVQKGKKNYYILKLN
jgi:tyrosyl-tRNA synthetase